MTQTEHPPITLCTFVNGIPLFTIDIVFVKLNCSALLQMDKSLKKMDYTITIRHSLFIKKSLA